MARVITLSGLTCLSGTSPSLPAGFDYCQPPATAQQVGAPVSAGDGWTYTKLVDASTPGVEYREYKNADGSEVYWLCGKPRGGFLGIPAWAWLAGGALGVGALAYYSSGRRGR